MYSSTFKKYDLINIVKNTRGRHTLPKAEKGKNYLVISSYTNNMGTTKYIVIDQGGQQHFTTEKSAKKITDFDLSENQGWQEAKRSWMDETYVPVFGVHTYDYAGMPYVSSRDGKARLIKPLCDIKRDGIWINSSVVHDDDVKLFLSSSFPPDSSKKGKRSEAVTFRIPLWIAEKNGFFNGNKSK
jgi:hypothetical protein